MKRERSKSNKLEQKNKKDSGSKEASFKTRFINTQIRAQQQVFTTQNFLAHL